MPQLGKTIMPDCESLISKMESGYFEISEENKIGGALKAIQKSMLPDADFHSQELPNLIGRQQI
ncbi:hypothetical protein ACTXT7_014884 [Hymenolepis weldensis]